MCCGRRGANDQSWAYGDILYESGEFRNAATSGLTTIDFDGMVPDNTISPILNTQVIGGDVHLIRRPLRFGRELRHGR